MISVSSKWLDSPPPRKIFNWKKTPPAKIAVRPFFSPLVDPVCVVAHAGQALNGSGGPVWRDLKNDEWLMGVVRISTLHNFDLYFLSHIFQVKTKDDATMGLQVATMNSKWNTCSKINYCNINMYSTYIYIYIYIFCSESAKYQFKKTIQSLSIHFLKMKSPGTSFECQFFVPSFWWEPTSVPWKLASPHSYLSSMGSFVTEASGH